MKNINRQTLPKLGRSTKKKNAGLSLHTTPPLFLATGIHSHIITKFLFYGDLKKKFLSFKSMGVYLVHSWQLNGLV